MDDGWTPIQSWKKNSVGNRPFRLSKVQEALPRSTKQEDYLGTPNTAQKDKRSRKKSRCGWRRHKASILHPAFPHFSISSNLFKSSCSSIFKPPLSIYRIKRACVFLNSLSRSVMWPNRCLMTLVKAYVTVNAHEPSKFGTL